MPSTKMAQIVMLRCICSWQFTVLGLIYHLMKFGIHVGKIDTGMRQNDCNLKLEMVP